MNVITKPDWLIYAEDIREQLNGINDTKNGERMERHIWDTYFKARNGIGYAGSLAIEHRTALAANVTGDKTVRLHSVTTGESTTFKIEKDMKRGDGRE